MSFFCAIFWICSFIVNNTKYVEELFEYCNYDETKKHYSGLCRNYIGFLEENGIDHLYNIE